MLIQNGVIVICNIIRFKSLPFWFRYRKMIKLRYLKKFGVKTEDQKKDNEDDSEDEDDNEDDNSDNKISTFNFE